MTWSLTTAKFCFRLIFRRQAARTQADVERNKVDASHVTEQLAIDRVALVKTKSELADAELRLKETCHKVEAREAEVRAASRELEELEAHLCLPAIASPAAAVGRSLPQARFAYAGERLRTEVDETGLGLTLQDLGDGPVIRRGTTLLLTQPHCPSGNAPAAGLQNDEIRSNVETTMGEGSLARRAASAAVAVQVLAAEAHALVAEVCECSVIIRRTLTLSFRKMRRR